ncbi:MAG: hypothetical protein E7578_05085 [Ruminococcaceae bacterium]|nr:hypothetical protein [Oscillospiraceae bacterium]
MDTKRIRQATLPLVICAVFMLLSRLSGIAYSFFATDVLYSDSQLPYVLQSVRQILHSVSIAFGGGAALWNIMKGKKATFPVVITSVVLLADSIVAVVYDLLRNVLGGRIVLAIGYRFTLFAYELIILIVGLVIANMLIKNKKPVALAAIAATALCPMIDLVYVLWSCLESLIEMEFLPYTDEIYTMACETATVLLATVFSGAVGIIIAKKYRRGKQASRVHK